MYIDPSAGSLILQMAAAGIVAGLAAISRVRTAVVSALKRLRFWRSA